jgi:CubicO group peptidase (beta-lactamase class C family)
MAAFVALAQCLTAQTFSTASPESVGMSRERLDRIKNVMNQKVADKQLVGGTILVARRGKIAYFESFGNVDLESGKPMPKDAIFRVFSMTKPFIAVALMTLYEQGKFSFQDPLSKYLPEFSNPQILHDSTDPVTKKHQYYTVPAVQQIRVVDLLRHTNGIEDRTRDEKGNMIIPDYRTHTLEEGIKMMAALPLAREPQSAFQYSQGPEVAGRLIEVLSGKPLDVYLEEAVFKPLGLVDSGFMVPESKWSRVPKLYQLGRDGSLAISTQTSTLEQQDNFKQKPKFLSGSAGLVSTNADLLKLYQMLLNGGELNGVRILSPTSVDLMTSDLLSPDMSSIHAGYGFGLGVEVNRGTSKTADAGSAGEFSWSGAAGTLFFVDPKEQLIGIILMQEMGGLDSAFQFRRMVYQSLTEREKSH